MSPSRIASAAILAAAALVLPGSLAAAKPAPPTVNITLGSHFYRPNPIYLAGGVPTRLVFANTSGKGHDFTAPEFFRAARITGGAAPNGKVSLGKGRVMVVDLVPTRGRYRVHCSMPFHTMLGMTGTIIVN